MMRFMPVALVIFMMLPGCAATRLRYNTSRQATTLSDIEEQQVLDNIAMFVATSGSTPFFALPTGGGTTTNQQAGASATLLWNPRAIVSETGNLTGQISLQENWTLKPINDPERIELMKCVLQQVTQTCPSDGCQDCHAKLTNFFGEHYALCSVPSCWYSVSCKKPKGSRCCMKVGHYCGTYVCVTPEYYEYLSRVTVAFLDIATVDSVALALRIKPKVTPLQTIQIEESFQVGEGDSKRMIKGLRNVSAVDYQAMLPKPETEAIMPFNYIPLESVSPSLLTRPRRETGPSIDSLIQMNGIIR